MNKPELKEGEIYVGAIIGADGEGQHIILLREQPKERMTWQEAMDWSKSVGGDLPTCIEQLLLIDQHVEFAGVWYWSNEPYRAWRQYFNSGYQGYFHEDYTLCARAVRRVQFTLEEIQ